MPHGCSLHQPACGAGPGGCAAASECPLNCSHGHSSSNFSLFRQSSTGSRQGTLIPSLSPESRLGADSHGDPATHPAALLWQGEGGGLSCLGLRPPPVLPCMAGSWGEETGLRLTAPSCRNLQVGRAGVRGHRPLLPTKPSLPDAPPQPVAALPHPLASLGTDWPQLPGSPVGVRDGGGFTHRTPAAPPGS